MTYIHILLAIAVLMFNVACGSQQPSAKEITAFSLSGYVGVINEANKTIVVSVPNSDTDVTAMVAAFTTTGTTVKVGSTIQKSGTTSNDFTNPLTYTVISADGSTRHYLVTVLVPRISGKGPHVSSVRLEAGTVFNLKITVNLGEDRGQGLGTIFEARDAQGRLFLGAGFQDSYSTNIRDNNRMISFYRKSQDDTSLENLGKPLAPKYTSVRLFADNNELNYFSYKQFFGTQYINNRRLLATKEGSSYCFTYDGKTVYASTYGTHMYYSNGFLFIYVYEPEPHIYIGSWDFENGNMINLELFNKFSVDGWPYCFGTYKHETIFVTNTGAVYSFYQGDLRLVKGVERGWQVYSIINVNDQLLLGSFPSGSLFVYNDTGLHEFAPPIPVPEGAYPNYREAQTLTMFGGDLYAGLWPWGELWRLDLDTLQWRFVDRLFTIPDVSFEPFYPYGTSAWGQRIISMVPNRDSLYISTMNQLGDYYDPELHPYISPLAVNEYGQVYRLTGPKQITSQIIWKPQTTFSFIIADNKMLIYQDDVLLAETESSLLNNAYTLNIGTGIYGTFAGTILGWFAL